jgi:putative oxidoreductase
MTSGHAISCRPVGESLMDRIKRILTRPVLRAAISTNGAQWIAPTRIALGMLLLVPVDADIQQRLAVPPADPSAWLITTTAIGMFLRALARRAILELIESTAMRLLV